MGFFFLTVRYPYSTYWSPMLWMHAVQVKCLPDVACSRSSGVVPKLHLNVAYTQLYLGDFHSGQAIAQVPETATSFYIWKCEKSNRKSEEVGENLVWMLLLPIYCIHYLEHVWKGSIFSSFSWVENGLSWKSSILTVKKYGQNPQPSALGGKLFVATTQTFLSGVPSKSPFWY